MMRGRASRGVRQEHEDSFSENSKWRETATPRTRRVIAAWRQKPLDDIAESLLTAVLQENRIPREEMRQNIRKHIVAHEAIVRRATAVVPEVQEDAIEEFRARFRASLDHEASHANADVARHLREVVEIFADKWADRQIPDVDVLAEGDKAPRPQPQGKTKGPGERR
jgi:hypothetical protein